MMPTVEFEAHQLKQALSRVTTNDLNSIIQIICTKNTSDMNKLASTYKKCKILIVYYGYIQLPKCIK